MAAYCMALVSWTIILEVSYFNERHDIRIPQQTAFQKDMYGSWQAYCEEEDHTMH
jgi:hypothetical protein